MNHHFFADRYLYSMMGRQLWGFARNARSFLESKKSQFCLL